MKNYVFYQIGIINFKINLNILLLTNIEIIIDRKVKIRHKEDNEYGRGGVVAQLTH